MLSALLLLAVQSTPVQKSIAVPEPAGVPVDPRLAPSAPHVLYLNFDGADLLYSGTQSDAIANKTFLLKPQYATTPCHFQPYTNSFRKPMVIALVQQFFSPFNVQIVTTRPAQGPYSMVMIGPDQSCIDIPAGTSAGGIGPLDCGDLRQSDISFAFDLGGSNTMAAVHALAATIAQESSHAYGLGHVANPQDLMFPFLCNVETGFLDMSMLVCDYGPNFPPCPQTPTLSQCAGQGSDCTGTGMQNSFQMLLADMGPNPNPGAPMISIASPQDGATVASAFSVTFNTNISVASVDLLLDGNKIGGSGSAPFTIDIPGGLVPAGMHTLKGQAKDSAGNTADSTQITVTVSAQGATPGDVGFPCTSQADCPNGICAQNGSSMFCTHTCDPADSLSCPGGYNCVAAGGTNVCGPAPQSKGGGCEMARSGDVSGAAFAALLLLATCISQRKRFRNR